MKNTLVVFLISSLTFLTAGCGDRASHDFNSWPEGSSPQEIGIRLVEKYLSTPHKNSGDVSSTDTPEQITYSEACTWLGSLWFASITDNDDLLERPEIMEGYHKMMATLLYYQADDGMWRQIIDDLEFWKETSSTAMFTYAMITGVKNGWLNEHRYGTAARKAWLSLVTYINNEDNLTDICEGTGTSSDRNHYLNRKRNTGDFHGQAPMLWCAAALLR